MQNSQTNNKLSSYVEDLQSGSRPKGGVRDILSGIPSIGGEHLNNLGAFDFSSIRYVPEEFAKSMTKGLIMQNDILIVKDGATTGKVSFVDSSFPFEKATINEHVFILRTNDKILPKFLFWYLWSEQGQREILNNFQGSAQGGINKSFIEGVNVPDFSIDEQRDFINKIDKFIPQTWINKDKLILAKTKIKKFRQAILSAAVTGKLTEEWREMNKDIESATILLEKIKQYKITDAKIQKQKDKILESYSNLNGESKIELPETWLSCQIGHIGEVTNGSTPSRKNQSYWHGNIPWVSSGEVINNYINVTREKITEEGFNNTSVKLLPKGTVLIAMIGEGKTRGRSAILNIEATTNQNIAAVRIDHKLVIPEYLWYWFQFQYENTRNFGGGSSQQALNCQRVRDLPFILPPLEEQKEIVRKVNYYFEIADKVEKQIERAEAKVSRLARSILTKTFRGSR